LSTKLCCVPLTSLSQNSRFAVVLQVIAFVIDYISITGLGI